MRFLVTLLIPMLLLAQEPQHPTPPPDVDKALRERATAFLQYQVEGNFRKAYDLVAEDSKDFYFGIDKVRIQSFKIEEVIFDEKFSQATVRATTVRKTLVAGLAFEIPGLIADLWKLEDGKWMWYHDPKLDGGVPFFPSLNTGGSAPPSTVDPKFLPKDTSPAAVAAAAANLIQPTTFDKSEARFTRGKAGVEEVVFHNGNRGQVKVYAKVNGDAPGISIEPAETFVGALADLTFKVSYTPDEKTPSAAVVRFEVQPFRSLYSFAVTVTPEAGQQK